MLLPDFFLRLPPAAAVLVLSAVFQTTNAQSLPRQTKTIELRELHVLPWPPVATIAPRYPPVLPGLRQRQLNTICGFIGGDPDLPATCSAGSHCAADVDHGAIGCCPNEGACTQGVFTGCVDANSDPQTELNPYVYTCKGDSVCYKNQFDGGYYQYGCGPSSELATKVAATAPGHSALNLVSLSVALTAQPTTLSEPTTIGTASSKRSSASRRTTSTEEETSTSSGISTDTTSAATTTAPSSSDRSTSETATATGSETSNTEPADDAAPAADSGRTKNTGAIIGGTIGGVAGVVLIIAVVALLLRRRRGNVRQGPGPNQSSEFIKSPIDGDNGHTFAPLPPQAREVTQVDTPQGPPMVYAHPGDRMHEYDNIVSSPYAQRDSDDYSQGMGGGPVAVGAAGSRLEQDEIPLTRDAEAFLQQTSSQPLSQPSTYQQPLFPQPTESRLQNIREEDSSDNSSPMTAYPPRSGDGSGALWHQNRRTRNPTWM